MACQADVSNLGFKLTIFSIVVGAVLPLGAVSILGLLFTGPFSNFLNLSLWMLLNGVVFVTFIIAAGLFAVSVKTLSILFAIDFFLVFLSSKIYPASQEWIAALYTPGIIAWSYYVAVRRKIPAPQVE
jgi:hypothetical protein